MVRTKHGKTLRMSIHGSGDISQDARSKGDKTKQQKKKKLRDTELTRNNAIKITIKVNPTQPLTGKICTSTLYTNM